MPKTLPLTLRLLGSLEVSRGPAGLKLPQSKKTRALLGFLVSTGKAHRRDRLCALLWDVADDPRGALRWSVSKLRALVDQPGIQRIVADRETVAFDPKGAFVDVLAVRERAAAARELAVDELERLAGLFRGEFLEGLDLPDFHDFQAWCIAGREEARRAHSAILSALIARLRHEYDAALPYARSLAAIDGLNDATQAEFIRLLLSSGRRAEAEQQYAAARKLMREAAPESAARLDQTWNSLVAITCRTPRPAPVFARFQETPSVDSRSRLVGREAERARILSMLQEVENRRIERGVLLTGEPGIGKTTLLRELAAEVQARGGTTLNGTAYEAEAGRPYGPWIDALRRIPAFSVGNTIGMGLAPLVPELPFGPAARQTRESLFGALVDLIAARAHSAAPVLLVMDNLQWCDEASAELLHYACRMSRNRPVMVALGARPGELAGNGPALGVVLGLKRDGLVEEIAVEPLSREDIRLLTASAAPGADAERVFALSAGNPLYALETARALPHLQDAVPSTVASLVQQRVASLPPQMVEVLRSCAVLGCAFNVRRIGDLTPLRTDELTAALEMMERHALLRVADPARSQGDYEFANEVVRRVVYGDISEPRRRLMHKRVAEVIHSVEGMEGACAAEIAHHAALGGDAAMAAEACIAASRRCLRIFANSEAEALARKGMSYASQLRDPERVRKQLELIEVSVKARRPQQPEQLAQEIETLAERALDFGCSDHARLGYHLLSVLRWEKGDWGDAERSTMRAELVSRAGCDREKVLAMADAARCLAILERDLANAERLVMQASVLAARIQIQPPSIPAAEGMLRLHDGEPEEAVALFEHARLLARSHGDRVDEYEALEWRVLTEIRRGNYEQGAALSRELVALGDKLRDGSEAPFARALAAICSLGTGGLSAGAEVETSAAELRKVDAKHRLVWVLTCAAEIEMSLGTAARAREKALEALEIARQLERRSDAVICLALLAEAGAALGNTGESQRWLRELRAAPDVGISKHARCRMEKTLAGCRPRSAMAKAKGTGNGKRDR